MSSGNLTQFKRFIRGIQAPPTFEDVEKTRTAYLLNAITQMLIVLAAGFSLFGLLWLQSRWTIYAVIVLLVTIGINGIMRRGYVRAASLVLSAILWGIFSLTLLIAEQGIHHIGFSGYILPILFASFLVSTRAGFGFAVLSSVFGLHILILEIRSGSMLTPLDDSIATWAAQSMFFLIAVVISHLATTSIRQALTRARQGEHELAGRNQELQHEMTQRQYAEEAYRSLVDHSLQGLIIFQDNRIVFANQAAADIIGYTTEELLALDDPTVLIYPEDLPRVFAHLTSQLAGQTATGRIEFRFSHKQGHLMWIELFAVAITYRGKPAVQSTTINITERKQADEALRQSEERFAKAFHANPASLAITTVDSGLFIDVNDSLAELFGYPREEMIGHTSSELNTWVDFGQRTDMLRRLREQGMTYQQEIAFRTKSGEIRQTLASFEMIRLGAETYLLGMLLDITKRKQADQQAMELMLERERLGVLTEFMRSVSHDLKTPLAIIQTTLELLERIPDPIRQKDRLRTIREQALLLEKFVQDILAISRLDHMPRLTLQPTDVNRLLRDVEERLHPTAERKNLATTLQLDGNVPLVPGDASELDRVFVNLVENALNYTPNNGTVAIRTGVEPSGAVVEVTDTGIGISEKDLPHIFERFYRSDQARSVEWRGTGLGLAIVKRIVELHQGSIEVESQQGHGSTFRVRLPIA